MLAKFVLRDKIKEGQAIDTETRNEIGNRAGTVGICLNLFMAISKIIIGILVSSISVLADGVNNSFDTASSIITVVGFKLSSKPEDKEHPYGHGRIEYITAVIISIFVILIGVQFIKASYDRVINPTIVKFDLLSFIILIISIFMKLWLSLFYKKLGKIINSKTLLATSYDNMGDVITTIVVLLPMISTIFTDFQIDGYVGILVSLMIIYNGIRLLGETVSPLIGNPPDPEVVSKIKEEILKEKNISNIHNIRYESYGANKGLMVMDVEMPGNLTLDKVHSYIDLCERRVSEKFNIDLVIHMEPKDCYSGHEKKIFNMLQDYVKENDWIYGIYDFHIESRPSPCGYVEVIVNGSKTNYSRYKLHEILSKRLKTIYNIEWKIRLVIDFD